MRIIRDSKKIKLPKDDIKKFFIQSWFSLVHMNSLDSHRVRCMNSVNIINELVEFISTEKSKLPGIQDDILLTTSESLEILSKDLIVQKHFKNHFNRIEPILNELQPKKPIPNVAAFYLQDFQSDLKKDYKQFIIEAIGQEVYTEKDYDNLFFYLGSLLSLLIHEGHSIEELFAIVRDIFISNKSHHKYSFDDNFNFAKGIISRQPSNYDIIFKLLGCSKFDSLKSILGDKISQEVKLTTADKNVTKFFNPGQNVLFAKFTVCAQDDRSAGLLAKKELDGILDLIRFELENRVISVENEFVAIRENDRNARKFRLPTIVPNPAKNINPKHFEDFVGCFNRIFQNEKLNSGSKEKIKSALRFYRMGRDSDLFENKFLNWWTALEYLTRTGEKGSIIDEVKSKLISILVPHYLEKHILSYKNALIFTGVRGIDDQTTTLDLFEILHDQKKYNGIAKQIVNIPFLKYRIDKFQQETNGPKALSDFILKHERHLDWHIHRIYRIRCDIVHSAEYSLNLNLLSANLEYYLKLLLDRIISSFTKNENIGSIDELFIRYQYANKRLHHEMERKNADLHKRILSEDFL